MERQTSATAPWPMAWLATFGVALVLRLSIDFWGPTVVDLAWARFGAFDESASRPAPAVVEIGRAQSLVLAGDRRYTVMVGVLVASTLEGAELWRFEVPREILGAPYVGPDGTLYVRSSRTLHALLPDGRVKWTFDLASVIEPPRGFAADGRGDNVAIAATADGAVYLGRYELRALRPDGTIRWSMWEPLRAHSLHVVDRVIYVFAPGDLTAVRISDGSILWRLVEEGSLHLAGLAADGTIFLGGGRLTAVDTRGRVRWRRRFESDVAGVAVTPDRLYVAATALYALNHDGDELWRFRPRRILFTTPIVSDNTVVVGGREVFGVDFAGRLQWRVALAMPQPLPRSTITQQPVGVRQIVAEPRGTLLAISSEYIVYRLTPR